MNKLSTPLFILQAGHVHPACKNFKPPITSEGFVSETPFLDQLNLKEGAKIMLTYNIDTSDGLTNGTTGTVVGFIKNDGEPAETSRDVHKVLIKFDEHKDGELIRAKN